MKTNPVRTPAKPPVARNEPAKKTGAFAKAMQEAAAPPPAALAPLPALAGPAAAETKQVRAVQLPPALAGLVNEIQVELQGAGKSEVRIEFESKTLDGLQVKITRENNKLAVEMNCRSAEVSRLLAHHVEGLTAALESRGYVAPVIEIRQTARSTPSQQQARQQGSGQDSGQREGGQSSGRQR